MPEAITPASEKLVPIDTSGNAVDVTLKEDKKDDVVATTEGDAPVVEIKEEKSVDVVEQSKDTTKSEELEEYSAGVKKRIDKLTKKCVKQNDVNRLLLIMLRKFKKKIKKL